MGGEEKKKLKAYIRNGEYPDVAISWRLYAYHPACFAICLKKKKKKKKKKKRAARCSTIALGSLWTPRWPPTGQHSK